MLVVTGSVALAEDNRDFVLGFVCQSRVSNDQSFIHFTPGLWVSLCLSLYECLCLWVSVSASICTNSEVVIFQLQL